MKTNRREFLSSSAALAASSTVAVPAVARSAGSANDRFRVSVIGMRRGLAHALSLARMGKGGDNVEVVSVCDCDMKTAEAAAKRLQSEFGKRPATVQDLREVMADKSARVSLATRTRTGSSSVSSRTEPPVVPSRLLLS